MTREDIYDHLAQVYLGKRKEADVRKKKQFSAWLLINIFITLFIFVSAFYGLTAFLTHKGSKQLENNIVFSLNQGPLKLSYDFVTAFHPQEAINLSIPKMDAKRYSNFRFAIRSQEGANPGIIKIIFKNKRNEISSYYLNSVNNQWTTINIPFSDFEEITDWSSLSDVSFVLESWNVADKIGTVLIDDVCFASVNKDIKNNQDQN